MIKNKSISIKYISVLLFFIFLFVITILQSCSVEKQIQPVLKFPRVGLDNPDSYRGYTTRYYRDSEGNAVQILLNRNTGRIVNVLANAANESIAFTARDKAGHPAKLDWESLEALVFAANKTRYLQYTLLSEDSQLDISMFLLASMRVERDFQYNKNHLQPFSSDYYSEDQLIELIGNIEKLPEHMRSRHLLKLGVKNIDALSARLIPNITFNENKEKSGVIIRQATFDGKNNLSLEISVNPNHSTIEILKDRIQIRSIQGEPVKLTIKIGTDSPSLTALYAKDIFNEKFINFYNRVKMETNQFSKKNKEHLSPEEKEKLLYFMRLERQIKGIELLSYHEKLMAGLPNFATYFGRDMIMSALMMEPIWTPKMLENVIACVLGKSSSGGEISHEESLGGQAIRENAAKYNELITEYLHYKRKQNNGAAERALTKSEKTLENLQLTKEQYHMKDDDYQFPVLMARYLTRPDISAQQKRQFLTSATGVKNGSSTLILLFRNLMYVSTSTQRYATNPDVKNLISFSRIDDKHWYPGSWRDSRAGYANGRFAMDINAIWAPNALESMAKILTVLSDIGFSKDDLLAALPEISDTILGRYMNDPGALQKAIKTWRLAIEHFKIQLTNPNIQSQVRTKLKWLPEAERSYWEKIIQKSAVNMDTVVFLALALDKDGKSIPIVNTDLAMLLFIENFTEQILDNKIKTEEFVKLLNVLTIRYPFGLFVEGLGPLVANDTYASRQIWESYKTDHYHSPKVVWGREVNLLILGLSKQILSAYDSNNKIRSEMLESYVRELRKILTKILTAAESSGLQHNELWGYIIKNGELNPVRYATSCDIQLWNLTNLSVQFLLSENSILKESYD